MKVKATIRRIRTLKKLDAFGLWLANRGHWWSKDDRRAFNKRVRELGG
jgi:hypothetical protein